MSDESPMAGLFDKAAKIPRSRRDLAQLSAQIEADIEAFIKAGGTVTHVPPGGSAGKDYRPNPKRQYIPPGRTKREST